VGQNFESGEISVEIKEKNESIKRKSSQVNRIPEADADSRISGSFRQLVKSVAAEFPP
jgi:hypothetical protein